MGVALELGASKTESRFVSSSNKVSTGEWLPVA